MSRVQYEEFCLHELFGSAPKRGIIIREKRKLYMARWILSFTNLALGTAEMQDRSQPLAKHRLSRASWVTSVQSMSWKSVHPVSHRALIVGVVTNSHTFVFGHFPSLGLLGLVT